MSSAIVWTLGLRNATNGKYLTVEAFGDAINCSGASLRKKQTFTLEAAEGGKVYFKTPKNNYFYGDNDGNIKGDADAPSADTEWQIVPQDDGTWALISAKGYYFHGTGTNLRAFEKVIFDGEGNPTNPCPADGKWVAHLAMHPQVNLFNVMRKRYVHQNGGALTTDEDIPWGSDALLNLVFFADHPAGRYGIVDCSGKYLQANGQLVDSPTPSCQFLLSFQENQITLRSEEGTYLSANGPDGTLKVKRKIITKEELFAIEDSQPQFTMVNERDGKTFFVSARNGSEIKADKQGDADDKERFQLIVNADGTVFFYCDTKKYWTIRGDNMVGGDADSPSDDCKFKVDYSLENRVRFISVKTGKYIFCKPNGALAATGDGSEPSAKFTFTIINRPQLLLRGQYGFMGLKGASGRVECNRATGDFFTLEAKDGFYHMKAPSGFWTVDADGVAATASAPANFVLEFVKPTHALVKHVESGKYLQGEQNGGLKATGSDVNVNTLWEF
jgi:fascin 1/2